MTDGEHDSQTFRLLRAEIAVQELRKVLAALAVRVNAVEEAHAHLDELEDGDQDEDEDEDE